MLEKILQKLDLREPEIKVYKAALFGGSGSISRIARDAELPRQTAYSIIQKLVELGIVRQSEKSGVKEFFADPDDLRLYSEKQKKKFGTLITDIEQEIPNLQEKLVKSRKRLPKVQYFEGTYGMKHVFELILEQYKKGAEKIFRGYGVNTYAETKLGDFVQEFLKKRADIGVKTKLLIGAGEDDFNITDEATRLGRTVRHIDVTPQKAGIYLVGGRVYLFSYTDEVGVMIENEAIVGFLKELFEDDWKKSS